MFKKFAALFAFLGLTSATVEETPHGVFVKEEDLTKMDGLRAKVESLTAELETATKDGAAALTKQTELQNKLDQATAQVTAKDTEIADLKTKLSGKPKAEQNPLSSGGAGTGDGKSTFAERTKNFAHNQLADQVLTSYGVTGTGKVKAEPKEEK